MGRGALINNHKYRFEVDSSTLHQNHTRPSGNLCSYCCFLLIGWNCYKPPYNYERFRVQDSVLKYLSDTSGLRSSQNTSNRQHLPMRTYVVVSINRATPIQTPKHCKPSIGSPNNAPLILGIPPMSAWVTEAQHPL